MHRLRQQNNCIHYQKAVSDRGLCIQKQQSLIKNISIISQYHDNSAIIN